MRSEVRVWMDALDAYRYSVDLRQYRFRFAHNGWFERNIVKGDREETIAFEEHFRRHASRYLEPWFEVVYWKLGSQPQVRNGTTQRIAAHLSRTTTAIELWDRCNEYLQSQSNSEARARFVTFHNLFGLKTDRIPVVATFPAFMDPESFAMVDNRIADWVRGAMDEHNNSDPTGVQLTQPLKTTRTSLAMEDFDFMIAWVNWCRHTALKLTRLSEGFRWRARDVEMTAFCAWGEKNVLKHPLISLPPVSPS